MRISVMYHCCVFMLYMIVLLLYTQGSHKNLTSEFKDFSRTFQGLNVYFPGLNSLSPHDALKHYFTSLKTYLIFLQPMVLERKCP